MTPDKYVVGLLFNDDLSAVVLIEKQRPKWQQGKLNGPGGHVEPNESLVDAICREFIEEAGVSPWPHRWKQVLTLTFVHVEVTFFTCADTDLFSAAKTQTDEVIVKINSLHAGLFPVIENIPHIIELAKQRLCYD